MILLPTGLLSSVLVTCVSRGLEAKMAARYSERDSTLCCCCCVCDCVVVRCFNLFLCLVKLCERLYEQERNTGLVCPGLGTDWCLELSGSWVLLKQKSLPWFVQNPESLCFFLTELASLCGWENYFLNKCWRISTLESSSAVGSESPLNWSSQHLKEQNTQVRRCLHW